MEVIEVVEVIEAAAAVEAATKAATKKCADCHEHKELRRFSKRNNIRDGLRSQCTSCMQDRNASRYAGEAHVVLRKMPHGPERDARIEDRRIRESTNDRFDEIVDGGNKLCIDCDHELVRSEFSYNKSAHDGLQGVCKYCGSARLCKRHAPIKTLAEPERSQRLAEALAKRPSRALDWVAPPPEQRRCSCCQITRDTWAFTSKGTSKKDRAGQLRSLCRGCDNSTILTLRASGADLAAIQAASNVVMDGIRVKDGQQPFSMVTHLDRKVAEIAEKVRKLPLTGGMATKPPALTLVPKKEQPTERVAAIANGQTHIVDHIAEKLAADVANNPTGVFISNREERANPKPDRAPRVSKGALSREEKALRHQERMDAVKDQQAGLDLTQLVKMDKGQVLKSFKRKMSGAKSRSRGFERVIPAAPAKAKSQEWSDLYLTNLDMDRLYDEAMRAGYVFFERPADWSGQWPFEPSPDKRDPSNQSYVAENLVMVPWIENRARGDAWLNVFDAWAKYRLGRQGLLNDGEISLDAALAKLSSLGMLNGKGKGAHYHAVMQAQKKAPALPREPVLEAAE
jgi:hypothetical protein